MVMAARIACRFATEKEETKQGVLAGVSPIPAADASAMNAPVSNMCVPYYTPHHPSQQV